MLTDEADNKKLGSREWVEAKMAKICMSLSHCSSSAEGGEEGGGGRQEGGRGREESSGS